MVWRNLDNDSFQTLYLSTLDQKVTKNKTPMKLKFYSSSKSLIYGIISKKECNKILQNEPLGTFLVRFSESSPGSFAVAYVADESSDRVKHYLVRPEDIGPNKSLPDFLNNKSQFGTILIFQWSTSTVTKKRKEEAFTMFGVSKKIAPTTQHGYVQDLETE